MRSQRSLFRILDANANRALEGMRVCEDIVRFDLESPPAFRHLRALRHGVARAVSQLPVSRLELVKTRASAHDVGKRAPASRLLSIEHMLLINFQRAKEALRVLEECARLLIPDVSATFQRLRFRTYEVERDTLLLAALRHR